MSKKAGHIHKLKRIKLGNKSYLVYKCVSPGCPHYFDVTLAEGRMCICWRCDEPMVITKATMDLAKPHCVDCTKRKKEIPIEAIEEFINKG